MASKLITPEQTENKGVKSNVHASRLITALEESFFNEDHSPAMPEDAQFGFRAILQTPEVILENSNPKNQTGFDMEFDIPFDDDMIANEAEFVVYNLSVSTANKFKVGNTIRMTAGYGDDTGIIFEGYISKVKTTRDGNDRKTTIYALDDVKYSPQMMAEKTYSANIKASTILKDLLGRLGLEIAIFKPQRDHTYDSETNVNGSIVENIKAYSDVCGVSTYIYKQKIYSRPIWDGDNLHFNINEETGMIGSPESFEEENENEEHVDKVFGFEIEMLLQHRMSTAGIVKMDSAQYTGEYRVVSGQHSYDGLSATTKIKSIDFGGTTVELINKPKEISISTAKEIYNPDNDSNTQLNNNAFMYFKNTKGTEEAPFPSVGITIYKSVTYNGETSNCTIVPFGQHIRDAIEPYAGAHYYLRSRYVDSNLTASCKINLDEVSLDAGDRNAFLCLGIISDGKKMGALDFGLAKIKGKDGWRGFHFSKNLQGNGDNLPDVEIGKHAYEGIVTIYLVNESTDTEDVLTCQISDATNVETVTFKANAGEYFARNNSNKAVLRFMRFMSLVPQNKEKDIDDNTSLKATMYDITLNGEPWKDTDIEYAWSVQGANINTLKLANVTKNSNGEFDVIDYIDLKHTNRLHS